METCARVLADGSVCGDALVWHSPCSKCAGRGQHCPSFRDQLAQQAAELEEREAAIAAREAAETEQG